MKNSCKNETFLYETAYKSYISLFEAIQRRSKKTLSGPQKPGGDGGTATPLDSIFNELKKIVLK